LTTNEKYIKHDRKLPFYDEISEQWYSTFNFVPNLRVFNFCTEWDTVDINLGA